MFWNKNTRYKVVKTLSISGLEKEVTELVNNGWIPVWGVAKTWFGQYFQAVWKPVE